MKIVFLLMLWVITPIATSAPASAASEEYPIKPIRYIVPFPPGSVDTVGRIIARELAAGLGQPVVVDNRGGAVGTIGAELVARAPGDGYTLLFSNISLAINATLMPKLPYDTIKDFAPISLVGRQANVFAIHPTVPAKSIKEFVSLALAKPGQINFGSGGANTLLATELFKSLTKTDIVGVPYNGIGPAITALLGGQIHFAMIPMAAALPHVSVGKLKALAVTSKYRSPLLPDVPTMNEAGIANYEFSNWYGLLTRSGTPRSVIDRLNKETRKAVGSETVKKQFTAQGIEPESSTPEDFLAYLKSETVKWGKVIKTTGLRFE